MQTLLIVLVVECLVNIGSGQNHRNHLRDPTQLGTVHFLLPLEGALGYYKIQTHKHFVYFRVVADPAKANNNLFMI